MKNKCLIAIGLLILTSCNYTYSENTSINSNFIANSSIVSSFQTSTSESSSSKYNPISTSINVDNVHSYYQSINFSKNGEGLMNDLHSLIKSFRSISYNNLNPYYAQTDSKEGNKYIWDMYSNENYSVNGKTCGNYSKEGDCWNKEHSIPQSWFNERSPMKSDLFHVYPTDGYVNGRRSNYPFGEVSSASYTSKNGSKVGKSSVINQNVFEPIDEYKGDFARTYFYFATCYMDKSINNSLGSYCFTGNNSYPKLTRYSIDLFLKWAKEDPISEKEIMRNEAVYLIQRNRNPFIDIPGLENKIWY